MSGSRPVYLSIAFGNNTPHNVRVTDIVDVEGHIIAYPYFNEVVNKSFMEGFGVFEEIVSLGTGEENKEEKKREKDK